MKKLEQFYLDSRKGIIAFFLVFAMVCAYFAYHIAFSFSFEQFFPEGDEDLTFFQEFIEEFETDDNFMLVAIENDGDVFDSTFLAKFHDFALKARSIPHVVSSQSLTQLKYPVKTPFGITTIPTIHINDPSQYEADKRKILEDERFVGTFISSNTQSMAVTMKNIESIGLEESKELMAALNGLLSQYDFKDYHVLGRAYFTDELVKMQIVEITRSTIISVLLTVIIMMLLYRKPIGVFVAMSSIGLGLLIFLGLLSMFGRELNAMSALYPVLMLIVGTSDVVHIMNKYLEELTNGATKENAIITTIKEIGLATLLTSLTTAAGFMSLATSKVATIREFGMNAAFGVMVAYVTVVLLTTAILSLFSKDQIIRASKKNNFWENMLSKINKSTIMHSSKILMAGVVFVLVCVFGISKITTNYRIESNLPIGSKLTEDFYFFEANYSGFRPIEFAVFAQNGLKANSFEVLMEIDKLEKEIRKVGNVKSVVSINTMHKSLNRMYNGNQLAYYKMPETERQFERNQSLLSRMPSMNANIMLSRDSTKTRVSTRILDIGADSIKAVGLQLDRFAATQLDTNIIKVRRTGTGLIVDKNAKYVTQNLLQGLAMALIVVSILMGILFKDFKMLLISLVPNLLPLLFAAAVVGYLGIELEAGVSIVFAIAFGIAVDDTIHFLSKYKLSRLKGMNVDDAIEVTFRETGKAIIFTSIILFFGFLVMLFSSHPPSVRIGVLISITLVSAVVCDLYLIPIFLRKWLK